MKHRTRMGAWLRGLPGLLGLVWMTGSGVLAQPFAYRPEEPTLDRWMYPFNFEPGTRRVAPTYGSFDPRFDTRDAEFLLGWDTAAAVVAQAGPARYLVRALRITLTSVAPSPLSPTKPFVYDPTHDSYTTYMTNEPGAELDLDPGRPIELFGVNFRGGFTAATFLENANFGPVGSFTSDTISIGTRNAYAVTFTEEGTLVDIANHVGQKNAGWTNAPFEVIPWSVGTTTNAAPGEEMPDGGRMTFELDLGDPLILTYVQQGLNEGRLRFMVSSLSPAGQSTPGGTGFGGAGAYPWWATREHLLYDPPSLELEGTLVSQEDADADGLPDDWERHWLGGLGESASDDSDRDGSDHRQEWLAGTDPRNPGSVLKIQQVSLDQGVLVLRFPFAASRTYTVEFSADLRQWEPQAGSLRFPERGIAEWRAVTPLEGVASRFLRLRVD